jgi:two-component system, chemotaxis family, sensor kinase Cph1
VSNTFIPAADFGECAAEPIHIPGSIQPHGYLFVLDASDLTVVSISKNAADVLCLPPAALIGRPITDLLESTTTATLGTALKSTRNDTTIRVRFQRSSQSAEWDGLAHQSDGFLLLELGAQIPAESIAALFRQFRSGIERIRHSQSMQTASEALAGEIRQLTGFDRVMVYRFDPAGMAR